jgi:hypothetical protein
MCPATIIVITFLFSSSLKRKKKEPPVFLLFIDLCLFYFEGKKSSTAVGQVKEQLVNVPHFQQEETRLKK